MKVSLNISQQVSSVDILSIGPDKIIQKIGAQLGAVEEVIDWGSRYDSIVVANVVDCQKHPNADKLSLCKIDDGGVIQNVERDEQGNVQVVCGAPNVRAGISVAWLPPGSVVPSSLDKDPFTLGARELRGVISNGMIASAHELGISDDHDGILELSTENTEIKPGTPFKTLFGLNDIIIDCENKMFTHRPDCFGILGVAREIAGINGLSFTSPDWYRDTATQSQEPAKPSLTLSSKNEITDKVPRFMVQVIEGVTVSSSSIDIQSSLARMGSKSINNIVDSTNYYMHLTAQPTHAFDYDKVAKLCDGETTIFPRMAQDGEMLALLNGKTIELTKDDIVIATNKQPIALAGVMGGSETEVDMSTKNIIVECATFDMYTIRRTSMRHGLFTDAVTRFNKGQSPRQNPIILRQLTREYCKQTGVVSGVVFDSGYNKDDTPIKVTTKFINERLGSSITATDMKTLLENVEFVVETQNDELTITPPFWRMDIEIPEDIVEEIGRLHDYGKLPVVLPSRSIKPQQKNPSVELKNNIRNILSTAGANEIVSYSFVSGKLIRDSGQNTDEAYQLSNALSPALEYYRLSLTPSLLSKVNPNIRAGYDRLSIFEIGKTHVKSHGVNDENVPKELGMLSLVYAQNDKHVAVGSGAAYYNARNYLDFLASKLGLTLTYKPINDGAEVEVARPFDISRSAYVYDLNSDTMIGIVGEYRNRVSHSHKLPSHCAGFEISTDALLDIVTPKNTYKTLAKYPSITQDITLSSEKYIAFSEIYNVLFKVLHDKNNDHGYTIDIHPLGIYQKDDKTPRNTSFRISLAHANRTLTTNEVNKFINNVTSQIESNLDVKRI